MKALFNLPGDFILGNAMQLNEYFRTWLDTTWHAAQQGVGSAYPEASKMEENISA